MEEKIELAFVLLEKEGSICDLFSDCKDCKSASYFCRHDDSPAYYSYEVCVSKCKQYIVKYLLESDL